MTKAETSFHALLGGTSTVRTTEGPAVGGSGSAPVGEVIPQILIDPLVRQACVQLLQDRRVVPSRTARRRGAGTDATARGALLDRTVTRIVRHLG
jgi:hypothetical protein